MLKTKLPDTSGLKGTSMHTKITDKLFLVQVQPQRTAAAQPVDSPVNHILVVDVSGSMYGELDRIREHIKTKLPRLLREADTLSLIAFSGRDQYWRILTAEPVATLKDLGDVNTAIDRWLRPVGLTGFKQPIEEAAKLIGEVSKKNSNPFSLFFLSDGCDNQWRREEILKAVDGTAAGLAASTVVEYGYYADRPMLTQMAERWGGSLIFSENFTKFSPLLDAAIQRKLGGGKKVTVDIQGDVIGGMAFAIQGSDILTFAVDNQKVTVPEGLGAVCYLSPTAVGTSVPETQTTTAAIYAAISLFAVRAKPDVVFPLLKKTGDVALIQEFANCFGKQRYSAFQEHAALAALDSGQRLTKGYNPDLVPREDATTVLDLLRILESDDGNRVLLGHPSFKYGRIGRKREDANLRLTADEQKELDALTTQMSGKLKLAEVKEIQAKMAALTNKPEPLKFVEDDGSEGYSVSNITFNEDRPNVSILVRKTGTVDLSARIPENLKGAGLGKVPERIGTFVYRNYTVIRDGIVNVNQLPVSLTDATKARIRVEVDAGRLPATTLAYNDGCDVLNLEGLPVVNRASVKSVSARKLFETQWALLKAQAAQKVLKSYQSTHTEGKVSEGYAALYGDEAATWLKDQGVTDFNGFNPKSVQTEATDVYQSKSLEVKVKGYSSLPSMTKYAEMAVKGKFNGPALLMQPTVERVEKFLASDTYKNVADPKALLKAWLHSETQLAVQECRKLLFEIAQMKTAITVGNCWFQEFKTIEENAMELTLDGVPLIFTAEAKETEEKV